jgi:HSP90 family molecular chaperone
VHVGRGVKTIISNETLMEAAGKEFSFAAKRNLQFNPGHKIIQKLNQLRQEDDAAAALVLEQLFDHAAPIDGRPPKSGKDRMQVME